MREFIVETFARLEYRLRFSVAHEIGHLVLHRDICAGLQLAPASKRMRRIAQWARSSLICLCQCSLTKHLDN